MNITTTISFCTTFKPIASSYSKAKISLCVCYNISLCYNANGYHLMIKQLIFFKNNLFVKLLILYI